jgi:hypothetical protein
VNDDYIPGLVPLADVSPIEYRAPAYAHAKATSHNANTSGRADSQRERCRLAIEASMTDEDTGLTYWAMARRVGIEVHSAAPRIWELNGKYRKLPWQWVIDSGRERKTGSGSLATVWFPRPDGAVEVQWRGEKECSPNTRGQFLPWDTRWTP